MIKNMICFYIIKCNKKEKEVSRRKGVKLLKKGLLRNNDKYSEERNAISELTQNERMKCIDR